MYLKQVIMLHVNIFQISQPAHVRRKSLNGIISDVETPQRVHLE